MSLGERRGRGRGGPRGGPVSRRLSSCRTAAIQVDMEPNEGKQLWTQENTEDLIFKYEGFPELWDVNSPLYRDRGRKQSATKALADHFCTTEGEINRKIHNLRNQMSQEVRKMKGVMCGESLEARYLGRWPFFNRLTFILPALFARSGAQAMNSSKNEEMYKNSYCQADLKPTFLRGEKLPVQAEVEQPDMLWSKTDIVRFGSTTNNNGYMVNNNGCSNTGCVNNSNNNSSNSSHNGYNNSSNSSNQRRPSSTPPTPEVLLREDEDDTSVGPPSKKQCEQPPADEYDIFGQYVASELRGFRSEYNRRKLKRIIQKSILEVCEQEDAEYSAEGTAGGWFRPLMGHDQQGNQCDQMEQHQNNPNNSYT